ncbi:Cyclic di-GMP phosphodiesterase response regulator RpfG [Roseimaritima multifibrata]|uniref:Cyclic di-GMP phosphodiesterase response regulator RpfG n=1 Tax=Roseimaritima multifibrata TaxID=1930274 RepID=A0A517MG24_9BACT|nr:HD domain-containing phosphohydrolase [Roseimaritima multifibrata]QDS93816.1 Cyclic di-GMP phosphodiesterase response regulator RpfG [Roseimaritima multifibrata]
MKDKLSTENTHVLVVDDDPIAAETLQHALTEYGYPTTIANDGVEAIHHVRTGKFRIVISDIEMPRMNGIELCREIRERSLCDYTYLILLTGRCDTESVIEGLDAGADDYMSKPFSPSELRMRIRAGERLLLQESRELMIFALAKLADSRDNETGSHLERIREFCRALCGELSSWEDYKEVIDGIYIQSIYESSPLHDIGKVGIPDRILLKPGKLTDDEFAIMSMHSQIGADTLQSVVDAHPEATVLKMAYQIALTHHERWDGTGYPRGLSGEQIPLCGRIVAVADVYDALTSERVYKKAFSHEKAVQIIREGAGTHFDPDIVKAFLRLEDFFRKIKTDFNESAERKDAEFLPRFKRNLEIVSSLQTL